MDKEINKKRREERGVMILDLEIFIKYDIRVDILLWIEVNKYHSPHYFYQIMIKNKTKLDRVA